MSKPLFLALGLMSGTSIDGVDTALIETDGREIVRPLGFTHTPYEPQFRELLRSCFGRATRDASVANAERVLTEKHALAVKHYLEQAHIEPDKISLIGFHGQTIFHKPDDGITVQIGDGALLANLTHIPVVNDFRTADVEAGGQGAPLVPLYHKALTSKLPKPLAIVNIGGISNVTWIGGNEDEDVLAFDMGPGNALIDDWMLSRKGVAFDKEGECAAEGTPDFTFVENFRRHAYFRQKAPKSLDREQFASFIPHGMSVEDGAATLTMLSAQAIADGFDLVPSKPATIYMTGGGRLNRTLCRWVQQKMGVRVVSVGDLGWNGDAIEAEAFAYLGVRSRLGLPLSMPLTTGVNEPTTGGVYHIPV